ncbi:MAG TPA: GntR family transcriptional regulator [Candidatus Fimivicinus intestinavium]|nr:GntR family transcriptional regulator [Candidatus Fimivicinus intestinavium]
MLDKTSYTPLYIQVKEYILNRIRAKEYQTGDRLPTERELMEQMQVGRATIRAAFSELEHEGYVEKRHGVGTFVKEPEPEMGFEPLISLSYALDKMGIRCVNRVVVDEIVPVQGGLLAERWEKGREVHRLKRVRFGEKIPVAVEDNYFTPTLYARISQSAKGEKSIAHAILTQKDLIVGKIDYSIVRRMPTGQEQSELRILPEQRVLEMTRWLYFEGEETPANFVQFILPERFMDYPFAAMKKE